MDLRSASSQPQASATRFSLSDASVFDGLVLLGMALFALTACWIFPIPFWIAELAVFAPPLVYLAVKFESVRAALDATFLTKAIVFCAVFYVSIGIRYGGWTGPSAFPTVFGVPIEQVLWAALVIPLSIAFAQRFFASPLAHAPPPYTRQVVYGLFAAGMALALIPPLRSLADGYVYLKLGLVLYPVIFFLAIPLGHRFLRELLFTGVVFFALHLGFELIALHHGYWAFQGEYIGWLHLFNHRIPLEELVFILALASPTAVAVHGLRFGWKGLPTPPRPQ